MNEAVHDRDPLIPSTPRPPPIPPPPPPQSLGSMSLGTSGRICPSTRIDGTAGCWKCSRPWYEVPSQPAADPSWQLQYAENRRRRAQQPEVRRWCHDWSPTTTSDGRPEPQAPPPGQPEDPAGLSRRRSSAPRKGGDAGRSTSPDHYGVFRFISREVIPSASFGTWLQNEAEGSRPGIQCARSLPKSVVPRAVGMKLY